jgi:hypothetical protein
METGQHAQGINHAGVTTKLHLAITAEQHIGEGLLTGGNVSDITGADALTAAVVGCYVVEDRGYDCDHHRRELQANNIIPVIPVRKNRKRIEMFFGRIKENRRLIVRYEKLDATFLGFMALGIVEAFYPGSCMANVQQIRPPIWATRHPERGRTMSCTLSAL